MQSIQYPHDILDYWDRNYINYVEFTEWAWGKSEEGNKNDNIYDCWMIRHPFHPITPNDSIWLSICKMMYIYEQIIVKPQDVKIMKIEETFLTMSESKFKSLCKLFSRRFQNGFEDIDFEIYYHDRIQGLKNLKEISELKFSAIVEKE